MKRKLFHNQSSPFLIGTLVLLFLIGTTLHAQSLKQGPADSPELLTADMQPYAYIQWSPDGSMLSFTEAGGSVLYVFSLDERQKRVLTEDEGAGFGHQWSHDGSQILYRATRFEDGERYQQIRAIGLDGVQTIFSGEYDRISPHAWRYEGRTMSAFSPDAVLRKGVGEEKQLSFDVSEESAIRDLPDFNRSFYFDEGYLYLVDHMTGEKSLLNEKESYNAVMSPDGRKVAFTEIDELVVMNLDGTGRRELGFGHYPTWLNNEQLVYEITTDDGMEYLTGDIYMINIDGTGKTNLTQSDQIERYPAASPDGSRIAFSTEEEGGLYIMNLR